MGNPQIVVDMSKLRHNLEMLSSFVKERGIKVAAVTKVFGAHPEMVELYSRIDSIDFLADSRLENFDNYPENLSKEKIQLRIPMVSEVCLLYTSDAADE